MTQQKYSIMIVAGEPSGDAHGARLVNALREAAPAAELDFFGAASHRLREAGVEEIVNADDFSVVGLPEIARALPRFWRDFKKLRTAALERRPAAVVLVDFPDFNLKLAKSLKKQGLKIIYYISPQLWAWRKYRVRTISKYVDRLLAILPFEKKWYAEQGVSHVEYVGNPTVREVHSKLTKAEFCARHGLDPDRPIVSLLAGSRHKEIVRILPELLETAAVMTKRDPRLQFVAALAPTRRRAEYEAAYELALSRNGALANVGLTVVQNETFEALNASDAAAVTSGTATLETGLIGTPLAIVYKTSALNYRLLRPLIAVEHFGLINLIAGERLARELIQDDFTPRTLADELFRLLDPGRNGQMRARLREIADQLGHGGASRRAAEVILREIGFSTKETAGGDL
ncbi:MAG: lipid-A-disaccharide synthase [Acidobacteria bacterium]|nr:lipid-A-disaccharide synthase [Acidobacteriota bacterium]